MVNNSPQWSKPLTNILQTTLNASTESWKLSCFSKSWQFNLIMTGIFLIILMTFLYVYCKTNFHKYMTSVCQGHWVNPSTSELKVICSPPWSSWAKGNLINRDYTSILLSLLAIYLSQRNLRNTSQRRSHIQTYLCILPTARQPQTLRGLNHTFWVTFFQYNIQFLSQQSHETGSSATIWYPFL